MILRVNIKVLHYITLHYHSPLDRNVQENGYVYVYGKFWTESSEMVIKFIRNLGWIVSSTLSMVERNNLFHCDHISFGLVE